MGGLVDLFGGSTVQAAQVSYASVTISADTPTYWPPYAQAATQQPLARIMDVVATAAGLSVLLPDATLAGPGMDVFFTNPGANAYTIKSATGSAIATVAPGATRYIYLSDNTTISGTWRTVLFGVGASSPDASQLAGSGLKAVGSTLSQSTITSTVSANQTFGQSDRAKTYVNTGGAISGTLPLTSAVGNDYFLELRNQGSGAWTLSPSGGELIDGSASIALQLNESCFVQAGTGAWYTVGRGRNTQFNFTQLVKPVTGGTTTLSLSEASNVVQTYTGTLTANQTLVLPAVVQVYYISNQTTGGFNFQIQSPTPGTVLSLPSGQNAVVFCDGTNVINASTSIGGIASLLLNAGSAAAPSLGVSATNTGIFAPNSSALAVSAAGTEQVRWTGGQTLVPAGTVGAPPYAFANALTTGMYAPAVGQIAWSQAGVQKLLLDGSSRLVPGSDNAQDLGAPGLRWGTLYATTINGTISTANSVAGGVAGAVPYQIAAGSTGFSAAGTSNQVLLSGGAGAPVWANQSSLVVGSAAAATNLAGGAAGGLPYQTGAGATSFLALGTLGQLLTAGASGPSYSNALPAAATINSFSVGYKEVPQNSQSAAYTTVLADSGKHIYHPSADVTARTWTIDSNANVPYPVGTAITLVNDVGAGAITIAITADTLVLAGTGSTGSRTLAAGGMATLLKIAATRWMISGSGLT